MNQTEQAKEKPPKGAGSEDEAEEWVPEDDAVIGRAFRWSLVVIAGIAVLVGIGFYAFRQTEEIRPDQVIAAMAPETVVRTAIAPQVRFVDITR